MSSVSSRGARVALIVVGVVAVLVGAVWMGQGANLIPGSFMTGNRMWLQIGFLVAAVGAVLIVLGVRRRRSERR